MSRHTPLLCNACPVCFKDVYLPDTEDRWDIYAFYEEKIEKGKEQTPAFFKCLPVALFACLELSACLFVQKVAWDREEKKKKKPQVEPACTHTHAMYMLEKRELRRERERDSHMPRAHAMPCPCSPLLHATVTTMSTHAHCHWEFLPFCFCLLFLCPNKVIITHPETRAKSRVPPRHTVLLVRICSEGEAESMPQLMFMVLGREKTKSTLMPAIFLFLCFVFEELPLCTHGVNEIRVPAYHSCY